MPTEEDTFEVRAYTREEVNYIVSQLRNCTDPRWNPIFRDAAIVPAEQFYHIRLDNGNGEVVLLYRRAD